MTSGCQVAVGAALALGLLTLSAPVSAEGSGGVSAARPDYGKLALRGDGMAQDSFSLALQAAARLLGRETDYATIAAMTTNAFSPAVNPEEECTSWWHVDGRLSTAADLQPLAARLGLRICRLPLPDSPGSAQPEVVQTVRQAMEAGSVIVVEDGWQWQGGPHGWVPWAWAGIITDARPDGALLGACLNGERDNPLADMGRMWAVSVGEPAAASRRGDLATLRQAVERLRGTGRFAPSDSRVYGLEAMDLWIKQMEVVPGFCRPCQEKAQRGWTDAVDNAVAIRDRSAVAASYLRGIAPTVSLAGRPYLESAAKHYERIGQLLAPTLTGDGSERYEQFVGVFARQKAHAEGVLRPVRAELSAAADDMAKALASPLSDALLVPGVPAGKGDGNEFARGLEVLLNHTGTPADYDTLMGDLGVAFMLQASDQAPRYGGALDVGWWPLDPACVPTYLDFVSRVVGQRIDFVALAPGSPEALPQAFREQILARAKASLQRGEPFLENYDFWTVVTGCDDGEPPLLGFCPAGKSPTPERLLAYGSAFAFLGEPMPMVDRHAADREALRHAVALGRDEVQMPWGFVTGQKAFTLWAQTLRDTEHLGEAGWHWNTVRHLTLNRASAIAYLRAMAARQPASAPHLKAAAARYEQTLARLREADLSEAALMSSAGREKLAALAEEIARVEADAVGELGKAVAAMPAR